MPNPPKRSNTRSKKNIAKDSPPSCLLSPSPPRKLAVNVTPRSDFPPSCSPSSSSPSKATRNVMEDNNNMWTKMDERLAKQSEFIISLLSKQMTESEAAITQKIDREINEIKNTISDINNRVVHLESSQVSTNSEIQLVKNDLNTIKTSLCKATTECLDAKRLLADKNSNHAELQSKLDHNVAELNELKQSFNHYDNRMVASDAFLFGIPSLPDENLRNLFNHLCQTIGIEPPILRNIYRTRAKNDSQNTAIMIKFNSPYDKNFALKSIADFQKSSKQQLSLHHIGFSVSHPSKPIYLRESLSTQNRGLFQRAMQMKKSKLISSVYTSGGVVYVKRQINSTPLSVNSFGDLERIASSANEEDNHNLT